MTSNTHTRFVYLLLLLCCSQAVYSQDLIQKTFSGIQKLELNAGSIEVSYQGQEDLETIQLEAFLGSNENSDKTLLMVTVGNTLKIAYEPPREYGHQKKFIRLKGPASIELDFVNGSGSLSVAGVRAEHTRLRVGSGQIQAREISGEVWAKGSSGTIRLESIHGDVTCLLTSGNATLHQIDGNLSFTATSGQLHASSVDGVLNARLTSGNMRLKQIVELGKLEITSGNIHADQAGLGRETYFSGSSGNINVRTTSDLTVYNFELQAGSGNIRVASQAQPGSLHIRNGDFPTIKGKINSGNIAIVPI
ncbi:DUF4097 family beta strand repeat-containing protein [Cyclobacterium xiamenense]|uniref:DUF4097 family beta strand repeat-containing protein n=1 Tax=Cyclobacterium xiamenense TaxID=1297121 RepID=UPI0035CF20FE